MTKMTDWKGLLEISERHNEELLEDLAQMENLIASQSVLIHSLQEKIDAVSELVEAKDRLIQAKTDGIVILEATIQKQSEHLRQLEDELAIVRANLTQVEAQRDAFAMKLAVYGLSLKPWDKVVE